MDLDMNVDIMFRVWDPVNGYDAEAAVGPDTVTSSWRVFPRVGQGWIELASPYWDKEADRPIFEGDLIRAFVGPDDVIHKGLVARDTHTGEWVVFDEVIRYDEHGHACVRNLETCSKIALSCLSHIQITGNIHDYEKD